MKEMKIFARKISEIFFLHLIDFRTNTFRTKILSFENTRIFARNGFARNGFVRKRWCLAKHQNFRTK